MRITRQIIGLLLGPLFFCLILVLVRTPDLSDAARAVLATTAWVATWWILEVIPIAATSLLPLILFPLTGAMTYKATAPGYADAMVFLYLAGFMLAVSIERWNLHRRIALTIIRAVGTDLRRIILGFMLATGFLSMWISNTATAVMMLPIGIAVAKQLTAGLDRSLLDPDDLGRALMLSIAYSASIGGISTIIGTPTNVILMGVIDEVYGVRIGFGEWMLFGLPISLGLLFFCWYYLVNFAFRLPARGGVAGGKAEIDRQLADLGPMTTPERRVLMVFVLVAAAWIGRSFLLQPLFPSINDTIIGLIGVLLMFLIPAGVPSVSSEDKTTQAKTTYLLNWETAEDIPWGILLLFGGGLALAAGFRETGLAEWIGGQLSLLAAVPYLVLLLVLIAAVNFLTEITSNVATASMLLPILSALALSIGVHPYGLMVAATVAASCAFMLPVATPPNAVVFGSGYLTIPGMIRVGIWLNVISIVVLTLLVYFLLPAAWGIDLSIYPSELRLPPGN